MLQKCKILFRSRKKTMGGTNQTTLAPVSVAGAKMNDLRLHQNAGEVHLHDDKAKKKFACNVTDFFAAWQDGKKRNFSPAVEIVGHDGNHNPTVAKFEKVMVGSVMDISITIEAVKTGDTFNKIEDFIKAG